jgi:hypothetical protein
MEATQRFFRSILLTSLVCLTFGEVAQAQLCKTPACWPRKSYKLDVVAKTGDVTAAGTITGFGDQPSIQRQGCHRFCRPDWCRKFRRRLYLGLAVGAGMDFSGFQQLGEKIWPRGSTSAIQNAGLVLGTVTTASSNTVAAGNVISESPVAGTQVNPGLAVNLVVSSGPALSCVNNLGGRGDAIRYYSGENRSDLDRNAKPVRATGLKPSCRRARLAFVSLRPVVLNLGV